MPVNRQELLQVIPQTGQTAIGKPNMTALHISQQLEGLLSAGSQAAVSVLGDMEQQKRVDNSAMEAMGKLQEATKDSQFQKDLFTQEAATQANAQAASLVGEKMTLAHMQLKDILDQKERGVLALVANSSVDQLRNLINDGSAQGMDPKGYLKLEERIGTRLASEDTATALQVIHTNPQIPVDSILGEMLTRQPLNSQIAKASYISTLTNDVKRFRDGEIINLMDQERQKGTENLYLRLQRDVAFDAQDGSFSPEKFVGRVQQFQKDYADLNPRTASSLDLFSQTAKALQGVVGSGALAKVSPERLQQVAIGIHELTKTDPMYMPLFASVVSDLNEQIKRVQGVRVNAVETMIKSADSLTDLQAAGATIATGVNSGQISPENGAALTTTLMKHQDEVGDLLRAKSRVFRTAGAQDVPLPETPAQDKGIDAAVTEYIASNPKVDPSGNRRKWTLPEVAAFTYDRTGRLTKSIIDTLNTSASIPLTGKPDDPAIQGWADAASTVKQLSAADPIYMRELARTNKLDARLSILANLHGLDGQSFTGMAQRLSHLDESNLLEARAILSGNTQFVRRNDPNAVKFEGADVTSAITDVKDLNKTVLDAFDGWLTWRADFGSARAVDAYKSAYTLAYATARQQSKGVADANSIAKSAAQQLLTTQYKTYDLGMPFTRYVVAPDFPVLTGLNAETAKKQAMSTFGEIWSDARNQVLDSAYNDNKINFKMSGYTNQVSLNLDDWKVEGTGRSAMVVVPIMVKGIEGDLSQEGSVFKYPLDPDAQKKLMDDLSARRAKMDAELRQYKGIYR